MYAGQVISWQSISAMNKHISSSFRFVIIIIYHVSDSLQLPHCSIVFQPYFSYNLL